VLDQATAIALSHAVITALFHRERSGMGQEVHVSLYSTALWLLAPTLMISNVLSIDPCHPIGRDQHSPLRNRFLCKDGNWIAGTNHPEEKFWPVFCNLTGKSELLDNTEFTDSDGNPVASAQLTALFDTIFLTRTRDEWMKIFLPHGLMFSPVNHIDEIQTDPQALANDYIVPFKHPVHGEWNVPGYPIHFSECKAGMRSSAPTQGEHTDEVLINMGYSEEEIKDLKNEGVIR
jgi:crotonobetainyl-CoA:carnitine CoA-transferase CaiB-like acyl-CoA transferase